VHLEVDRKLPVPIKEKVGRKLQHLQDEGIITPVREPSAWITALLVVAKANGDIRICIDPKPLNKALLRDHYPMPTIDECYHNLQMRRSFPRWMPGMHFGTWPSTKKAVNLQRSRLLSANSDGYVYLKA